MTGVTSLACMAGVRSCPGGVHNAAMDPSALLRNAVPNSAKRPAQAAATPADDAEPASEPTSGTEPAFGTESGTVMFSSVARSFAAAAGPDPSRFWRNSSGSARWMRYLSLVYTGFWVIQPIYQHSWEMWLWFGVVYVAFMGLYFGIPYTEGRLQRVLLGQLFALGYIYYPFNQSASGIFVYAVVILAFMTNNMRAYVTVLLLQSAGIVLEATLFHLQWWTAAMGIFFSLVVGFSNFAYSRQQRTAYQLSLANDEIEHLAQVAERERIARDLHDLLGHTLTVIAIKSELANRVLAVDPERAAQEMQEVEQTARKALAEVREAVTGYRSEGITAEVQRARRTLLAAAVQLTVRMEPLALSAAQANVLCLALREAVTNIVRHAGASTATLTVEQNGPILRFTMEDNGVGAGTALGVYGCAGNGLRGMTERVEQQGGRVRLAAGAEGGTVLTVTLPVEVAAAAVNPVREQGAVPRMGALPPLGSEAR